MIKCENPQFMSPKTYAEQEAALVQQAQTFAANWRARENRMPSVKSLKNKTSLAAKIEACKLEMGTLYIGHKSNYVKRKTPMTTEQSLKRLRKEASWRLV